MSQQSEYLMTFELQFGLKEHSSTIMCSTLLVETVEYYVSNNSSVYVLLIDASKAFDRLCHSNLFDVLEIYNSLSSDKPYLTLCGKPVDVVDTDLHLGNRIYDNIYTQCSNSMISDFYRRSYEVKASSRMCNSFTLKHLHSIFCNSFMALNYITLIRPH